MYNVHNSMGCDDGSIVQSHTIHTGIEHVVVVLTTTEKENNKNVKKREDNTIQQLS